MKDKTHYQNQVAHLIFSRYSKGAEKEELIKLNEIYLNEVTESKQIDKKVNDLVKVVMGDFI